MNYKFEIMHFNTDNYSAFVFSYFTVVHLIQGLRDTRCRELLNEFVVRR